VHRYLVTGTDTGVGKTRVAACIAVALRQRGEAPTIVKLVQTGATGDRVGDAQFAGSLAQCNYAELARFIKPADPWSAALAEGLPAVHAEDLALELERFEGAVVAEGAGGLAVPLNASQDFATVAALAKLSVVLAVGLRVGCMNHALLTLSLCEERRLAVAGCVLVDRWKRSDESYVADVRRVLQGKAKMLGILPFEPDGRRGVETGARLFEELPAEGEA